MEENEDLVLEVTTRSYLYDNSSPEKYWQNYRVKIQMIKDQEVFEEIEIGYIEINIMDLHAAVENGYSIDSVIGQAYHYDSLRNLFDLEWNAIDPCICEHFDYPFYLLNVAEIETFKIKQEYRRRGLGEKALKSLIELFSSSCGLFVVKPFPLQFDHSPFHPNKGDYGFNDFKYSEKAAFKKLKKFYRRSGFHEIEPFKDYMFCYREPVLTGIIFEMSGKR